MSRAVREALYDYGPPTTVGTGADQDDAGIPHDGSGAVETDEEGDSPLAPPPDADTITEPGGSPTDEVLAAHDPSITTLTPDTAVADADVTVTVTGKRFGPDAVVEVDQVAVATVAVSDTELTVVLNEAAGTYEMTVRNPGAEQESNTVDFTFTAPEE